MKKFAFLLSLMIFSLNALFAQLNVFSTGVVKATNQVKITSNSSNPTDGFDVTGYNPNLVNSIDLIWGYYGVSQTNNAGLITMMSTDGACFTVRANGRVGIFNHEPSEALEIGTTGTDYNIKLNGTLIQSSDERLKENIKNITNSLAQLKQLRSVSYNFKQQTTVQKSKKSVFSDSVDLIKPIFTPKSNTINRTHYGFLAQEVQTLFPDLVYKDSAGMLGVDYIGMIPLLVTALQNQQTQIDNLTTLVGKLSSSSQKVSSSSSSNTSETSTETDVLSYPVLEQNIPNPFNIATAIGFYLPNSISAASIYVYDMNGSQLKSISITERGKGTVTIQGSELTAGMYLYAMIADGKVIDTKRMILTK
jgi:hypothetical protein